MKIRVLFTTFHLHDFPDYLEVSLFGIRAFGTDKTKNARWYHHRTFSFIQIFYLNNLQKSSPKA